MPMTCQHCGRTVYSDNETNEGWPYAAESGGFWCDSDDAIDARHDEGNAR